MQCICKQCLITIVRVFDNSSIETLNEKLFTIAIVNIC